jgi:hypothetical protein
MLHLLHGYLSSLLKANHDTTMECERIGIPTCEFAELSIDALKPIEKELVVFGP